MVCSKIDCRPMISKNIVSYNVDPCLTVSDNIDWGPMVNNNINYSPMSQQ